MEELAQNPAFQTYALCSSILALKLFWSSVYSGIQRQRNQGYTNPEDARVFGGGAEAAPIEAPAVAHALRIQRNDAENLPAFFAIGLIFVLSGASPASAAAYLWTFTISRLLHTFFYTNQMQPWRALSFGAGALSVIGMSVQTITAMV
jgi:glutathione S-transferase